MAAYVGRGRCWSVAVVTLLFGSVALPSAATAADERVRAPGPVAAAADKEGEDGSEQSPRDGAERRGRRLVRGPIPDPWSVGVRVLWRSTAGVGGGGLRPITGGGPTAINASCTAGGACSTSAAGYGSAAPGGPGGRSNLAVQGIAVDAGRLITPGVEVGVGMDVTTHPGDAILSRSSPADAVAAFREVTAGQSAAQVLAGERAMQLDLAGRLTYRFNAEPSRATEVPRARPYVGVGVGLSRYFAGYETLGLAAAGADSAILPFPTAFEAWVPHVQLYAGATVGLGTLVPLLDVDFRYLRAAHGGLPLGGFRFGTGIRYPF